MSTVPRWYWPVALLPAVILGCLYGAVVTHRSMPGGRCLMAPNSLGMAFSLYAALVLLGYILLICCWRRQRVPEGARPNDGADRHRSDENV